MKFSDEVMTVLRNFTSINPSIQFIKGEKRLRTVSPSTTILAEAELDNEIDHDFCIYDLSRFLGVVSMFDDPGFEVNGKQMVIRERGRVVSYTSADPEVLVLPPRKNIDATKGDTIKVHIKFEQLREIQKALGVLGMPDLVIASDGEKTILRATDVKNKDSDNYDIEIGESDRKFTAVIKAENLKLLPCDYDAIINTQGLIYFSGDKVRYWVSLEESSEF